MRLHPERQIDPPEPSIDDFIREDQERKEREHAQWLIVNAILHGNDPAFFGQSENGDAIMRLVQKLLVPPLSTLGSAKKWETLETGLRGLASEWAVFTLGEK